MSKHTLKRCKGTIKRAKYQMNLGISEREYLKRQLKVFFINFFEHE